MTTAFVTGGNGFIGSHVVEALRARGSRVRALVRDPEKLRWAEPGDAEWVVGDLGGDIDSLPAALDGVDVVYHLAALTRARTEAEIVAVNVEGTRRLLDAASAAARPPRVVLLSSQTAWGPSPGDAPVDERSPSRPVSAYGRSKLEAEKRLATYARTTGAEVAMVRAPAVYGPRDTAFVVLFRQAANHVLPRLTGRRKLSIVHVDDLVAGLLALGTSGSGVYTFTDGSDHDMSELLDAIATAVGGFVARVPVPSSVYVALVWAWEQASKLTGSLPPYTVERARESAAPNWTCRDSRARTEIGYASSVALAEGMQHTARWYREAGWLR